MQTITVRGLSKVFRAKQKQPGLRGSMQQLVRPTYVERQALAPLDLDVDAGEAVAFLGPNGAGKSTTIKMLTGILHPTSGDARVLGLCPWKERLDLTYRIGCVFGQKSQLWYHLPPMDTFHLMSRIYELEDAAYRERRDWLIDAFGIGAYVRTPVRKLSLGERMRCEIAASLLHRPDILFLDEPTIGLDVIAKQQIRDVIAHIHREEGVTLFLTSHDAGDVEHLCRRAVVIDHGERILDQSVDAMKREFLQKKTVRLRFSEAGQTLEPSPALRVLAQDPYGCTVEVDLSVQPIEAVMAHIVGHHPIEDLTVEDASMEEIISHIYLSTRGERQDSRGVGG